MNLNYQMDHIQYQIFKTILSIFIKKHSEIVDDPPIEIFVSKNENRITFKIKNGYYLELSTPETMKLLGSTESKITAEQNSEKILHLEIVELVLIDCNIIYICSKQTIW